MDQYTSNVLKPKISDVSPPVNKNLEDVYNLNQNLDRNLADSGRANYKQTQSFDNILPQNGYKDLRHSYDNTISNDAIGNLNTNASSSLDYENITKKDKLSKQQMYKDILNYQCKLNKQLRSQGGMTKTEKRMNKRELHAYKNYENSSFGMIPGLDSFSKFARFK